MIPVMEDNGNMALRVIAFDTAGNEYSSKKVNVKVDVARKLSLGGVTEGQTIDKYVSLFVSKNFNVSTAEYV